MKKDALKELGKLFYDIGKIIFAVAVIAPFIKGGSFSYEMMGVSLGVWYIGTELINLGGEK
ncbi:hypothetical protein [Hydrogenimonas thermophila]|uniref:Uncharacterized protein n=1 Tax=Hydrogenimonas thermophila TaxID=223786 RepID=A0A1I5T1R1_9BACT|nr:hypothetical protein [Hydrogenimonas thermophila]SFP76781.1 hypothetical protein SAMN05216234_13916 [Hydrogenimonas thermophila]